MIVSRVGVAWVGIFFFSNTVCADHAELLVRYPKLNQQPFGKGVFAHVRRPGGRMSAQHRKELETLVAHPHIAGSQMSYTWSELEPRHGEYQWSLLDQDLDPWAKHGKKCWIEISAADQRAIGSRSGLGPPEWIFEAGVPHIGGDQTAKYPVFWDTQYKKLWNQFVESLAAKLDGDPRIEFISTGGYSSGHEPNLASRDNSVLMASWTRAGFDGFRSDSTYLHEAIEPILATYARAFKKTPVAQTINVRTQFDAAVNQLAAGHGFVLISNGMSYRTATEQARRHWRSRREKYRTKVGYAEWGPAGRGGRRRPRGTRASSGQIPLAPARLLTIYRGVIGDDAVPELRPSSQLSYVPLGMRQAQVETEEEWNQAIRWAAEHLVR